MIEYRRGDCLQKSEENRIIAHIVNNKGGFGKGFALSVAKKYPVVSDKYKAWYGNSLIYGDAKFKLGDIQPITITWNLTVVNMLAQNGYASPSNKVPLDYQALETCLKKLKYFNKDNAQIWMPKIGSGLAKGDWSVIESIINKTLEKEKVVVFEL